MRLGMFGKRKHSTKRFALTTRISYLSSTLAKLWKILTHFLNMKLPEKNIQIHGGVAILGSLFWEDESNCVSGQEIKGKLRKRWRDDNLDITKTIAISLPVRYGRFSSKANRKETYTMVLSNEYNG